MVKFFVAQDTFNADLEGGGIMTVTKGEVLPDTHELVKRDAAGTGTLFKLMAGQEDEPAAKKTTRAAKSAGGT